MVLHEKVVSLIKEKSFGHIAFIDNDGFPHVTPVWVDTDGEHVIVNTAMGRKKQRLAEEGKPVSIEISNPSNPYRYALIKGKILKQTFDGAEEHINQMAKKYTGAEKYTKSSEDEKRVLIYIKPVKVITNF
ncbi:MAG: pyridoxamine 5'-phosphate oxidase family protein [Nitrososphaeria archaeon]